MREEASAVLMKTTRRPVRSMGWNQAFLQYLLAALSVSIPTGFFAYAAIDTGMTLVGGPASAIQKIYAQIPGSAPGTGSRQGTTHIVRISAVWYQEARYIRSEWDCRRHFFSGSSFRVCFVTPIRYWLRFRKTCTRCSGVTPLQLGLLSCPQLRW